MVTYSKVHKFRICDTSTSNPLELLIEKNKGARLSEGKVITMGPEIAF